MNLYDFAVVVPIHRVTYSSNRLILRSFLRRTNTDKLQDGIEMGKKQVISQFLLLSLVF